MRCMQWKIELLRFESGKNKVKKTISPIIYFFILLNINYLKKVIIVTLFNCIIKVHINSDTPIIRTNLTLQ